MENFLKKNIWQGCGKVSAVGGSIKSMVGIKVGGRTCSLTATLIPVAAKPGLMRCGLKQRKAFLFLFSEGNGFFREGSCCPY